MPPNDERFLSMDMRDIYLEFMACKEHDDYIESLMPTPGNSEMDGDGEIVGTSPYTEDELIDMMEQAESEGRSLEDILKEK